MQPINHTKWNCPEHSTTNCFKDTDDDHRRTTSGTSRTTQKIEPNAIRESTKCTSENKNLNCEYTMYPTVLQLSRGADLQYVVKWYEYSAADDTIEPSANKLSYFITQYCTNQRQRHAWSCHHKIYASNITARTRQPSKKEELRSAKVLIYRAKWQKSTPDRQMLWSMKGYKPYSDDDKELCNETGGLINQSKLSCTSQLYSNYQKSCPSLFTKKQPMVELSPALSSGTLQTRSRHSALCRPPALWSLCIVIISTSQCLDIFAWNTILRPTNVIKIWIKDSSHSSAWKY